MANGQEIQMVKKKTFLVADMKYGRTLAALFLISATENADLGIKAGFASNTQSNTQKIMCRGKAHNNEFDLTS